MSNIDPKQTEKALFDNHSKGEILSEKSVTNTGLPSILRSYGLAIGLFIITIGISAVLKYFEIKVNLTILVVVTLVIAAWYGGLGPGLLLAVLVQAAVVLLNPIPAGESIAQTIFGYISVFSLLILLVFLISGRKEYEKKLRESEKRYRHLFENNPFPMWVYDIKTLKFLAVNYAAVFFLRIFGKRISVDDY